MSSGCLIMDEDSLPIREYRVEKAHKELDDRFDNAIKESELYLEELKQTLPMAIDLEMNSSSPYTPEGRLLAKKIHEVEEVISSLRDARKSVVVVYLGRLSLLDNRRPYREAQLDRIRDLSTLSHLSKELVDLRMGALKRTKNSMVCMLGKFRRELEGLYVSKKDPSVEEDGQSTPYAAFLVDNCETAARNVILACADTGWRNFIGVRARANKFHEEMVDWWEQLKEESVVTPACDLDETMEGLQRLMSLASAGRERLNTSIEINKVSLENDKLLLECVSRENPDEKEMDEDNRVVKDLMRTLESHRKKMKVDNAVIREFLINIVDRLDSMDETA